MGISLTHLLIIFVIVMIIWGPSRLGHLGRGIGEAVRGFKKGLKGDTSSDAIDVTPREQLSDAETVQKNQDQTRG